MGNNEPIATTVEELNKLINNENFIGEPIEAEDKILIPVMRMGFGFAGGKGKKKNDDAMLASGAAAGIEPIAMVVISKDVKGIEGIRVLDITKGNNINKAINDLGLVITDLIKDHIPKKDKKDTEKNDDDNP